MPEPMIRHPGDEAGIVFPVGGEITFKVRGEHTGGRLTALETIAAPARDVRAHARERGRSRCRSSTGGSASAWATRSRTPWKARSSTFRAASRTPGRPSATGRRACSCSSRPRAWSASSTPSRRATHPDRRRSPGPPGPPGWTSSAPRSAVAGRAEPSPSLRERLEPLARAGDRPRVIPPEGGPEHGRQHAQKRSVGRDAPVEAHMRPPPGSGVSVHVPRPRRSPATSPSRMWAAAQDRRRAGPELIGEPSLEAGGRAAPDARRSIGLDREVDGPPPLGVVRPSSSAANTDSIGAATSHSSTKT